MAQQHRKVLQALWVRLLQVTGALWWAKRQLRRQGALIVLTFHRVLRDRDAETTYSQPEIIIRERTFADLMAHVSQHFEVADLRHALPGPYSARLRIAITFDDGWSDNYSTALPIARLHRIPFTIFICPGLLGSEMPFWPERITALYRARNANVTKGEIKTVIENLKIRKPDEIAVLFPEQTDSQAGDALVAGAAMTNDTTLSWNEVSEMHLAGVNFGSHTQTHQILTNLPATEAQVEIRRSREAIESRLSMRCDTFAYPNGDWSQQARDLIAEEGFRLSFTAQRGAWTGDCDFLAIPRCNISEENVVDLKGHFSPAMFDYTTFWKSRFAVKKQPGLKSRHTVNDVPVAALARRGR